MPVDADPPLRVCRAFVAAAPLDGAAFTVMTSDAWRDTVCASDPVIRAVVDLQFGLGEGPEVEVFRTRRPVLISDLSGAEPADRWPVFTAETAKLPVGSLFAFPMQLGAITVGVCTGYRRRTGLPSPGQLAALLRGVDVATVSLLAARAGAADDELDVAWLDGHDGDRRVVYQAIGMLIVQLAVDAEQAFTRLRAHAFAEGRTIDAVAAEIVARRLRLERDPL